VDGWHGGRRECVADRNRSLVRYREMLAYVLQAISAHPKAIRDIAAGLRARYPDLPSNARADAIVRSALAMLDTFGVVVVTDAGTCHCHDNRISLYFLRSLAWYFDNQEPLLENWTRPGVSGVISIESLLDSAPYFLRLMETKRVAVASERAAQAEPIRTQSVAFVLVKTVRGTDSYFLFEWDRRAEQYQLIGGRVEHSEDPLHAARRELMEELDVKGDRKLEHRRDFELELLTPRDRPIRWSGISHTYGVWTEYTVWVCRAQLNVAALRLGDQNRWLSVEEMFSGRTRSGERTGDPALHREIDASLPGGLGDVAVSVDVGAIPNFPVPDA
jgi:8-oxo-dGTP pyrophosphatase MutT (NUDIX family)